MRLIGTYLRGGGPAGNRKRPLAQTCFRGLMRNAWPRSRRASSCRLRWMRSWALSSTAESSSASFEARESSSIASVNATDRSGRGMLGHWEASVGGSKRPAEVLEKPSSAAGDGDGDEKERSTSASARAASWTGSHCSCKRRPGWACLRELRNWKTEDFCACSASTCKAEPKGPGPLPGWCLLIVAGKPEHLRSSVARAPSSTATDWSLEPGLSTLHATLRRSCLRTN
mmetsp:Transcript_69790/g.204279  ORF Transcript_69790/g.204279 Transcript_69790/m.204279 type:complete len:228 (+) Transcript_69790:70-753(+)